jgi:hypothetical protein
LIADICSGYPQTIVHGYQTCLTCHLSVDGGDAINNYGRAMTEEFMASFAREGEAREFLGMAESDSVDLMLHYRSMELTDARTGKRDQFPMYTVAQLGIRHAGLTLFGSAGYFGRDRTYQTRNYYVSYHVTDNSHHLDWKFGYWIPVVGIGLNNHDLSIKKGQGFGRGQEKFIGQLTYTSKWIQAKLITARRDIRIEKNEDNWPKNTSENPEELLWQLSFLRIQGIDFGIHNRQTDGINTLQGYSLRVAKKHAYIFLQQDLDPSKAVRTNYGRMGFFPFRGLDLFYEYDALENAKSAVARRGLGFSWMIRPRFEYEGGYSQWEEQAMYQTSLKLWL